MFTSILFPSGTFPPVSQDSDFLRDFNILQMINSIEEANPHCSLRDMYSTPLRSLTDIRYRHAVWQDIEQEVTRNAVYSFSQKINAMQEELRHSEKIFNEYQKQNCFLDAVRMYCDGIDTFSQTLAKSPITSKGLNDFKEYLHGYIQSDDFIRLRSDADALFAGLHDISYDLRIRDNSVQVRGHQEDTDFSTEIETFFARFRQEEVKDYRKKYVWKDTMNSVEAAILDRVAKLNPGPFTRLAAFYQDNQTYIPELITNFIREIQFYLSWYDYTSDLRRNGSHFCRPELSLTDKAECVTGCFDLALAKYLIPHQQKAVSNDYSLSQEERIIVVTGPNQGGKTTFARTFGQIHYIAALGLPVPARSAALFLPDAFYTHFEREESLQENHGKLQDELVRIYEILQQATPDSLIALNEIFASTTLEDAVSLSREIIQQIALLDCTCIWVTFLDELAVIDRKVVSMVATTEPSTKAVRTYKLERHPPDGRAYAQSLAKKHGLSYQNIQRRLQR